jgi:hypothetical protein
VALPAATGRAAGALVAGGPGRPGSAGSRRDRSGDPRVVLHLVAARGGPRAWPARRPERAREHPHRPVVGRRHPRVAGRTDRQGRRARHRGRAERAAGLPASGRGRRAGNEPRPSPAAAGERCPAPTKGRMGSIGHGPPVLRAREIAPAAGRRGARTSGEDDRIGRSTCGYLGSAAIGTGSTLGAGRHGRGRNGERLCDGERDGPVRPEWASRSPVRWPPRSRGSAGACRAALCAGRHRGPPAPPRCRVARPPRCAG